MEARGLTAKKPGCLVQNGPICVPQLLASQADALNKWFSNICQTNQDSRTSHPKIFEPLLCFTQSHHRVQPFYFKQVLANSLKL
ncbi:hypothetical protein EG68_04533 [Paragonimus skrjabini miyazakii]|uniref:Uncharacterized protein n=1 Tax=Paragonimus skrjabini miyazakii TaxID=59628 RepID=A0A8S9Z3G0_9TREM|nr:hypothetical protein EG68_04533 [Paragonimus skrjabini miyazakii]